MEFCVSIVLALLCCWLLGFFDYRSMTIFGSITASVGLISSSFLNDFGLFYFTYSVVLGIHSEFVLVNVIHLKCSSWVYQINYYKIYEYQIISPAEVSLTVLFRALSCLFSRYWNGFSICPCTSCTTNVF